jgi:hypothetical protein
VLVLRDTHCETTGDFNQVVDTIKQSWRGRVVGCGRDLSEQASLEQAGNQLLEQLPFGGTVVVEPDREER